MSSLLDSRIGCKRANVLNTLQCGRALAALGVVIAHSSSLTILRVASMPIWVRDSFRFCSLGVDFFFVLSGFVILNAHFEACGKRETFSDYWLKRISRIYVPYLPISLGMMVAYAVFPRLSTIDRDWGVLTSLFLFPTGHTAALAVAWTLEHELLFYFIFAFYFVSRELFIIVLGVWIVGIVAHSSGLFQVKTPIFETLVKPINLEFVFGLCCACAYRKLNPRRGGWLILAGLAGLMILLVLFEFDSFAPLGLNIQNFSVLIGLAFAFIVVGLALAETSLRRWIPSGLVAIGDASYAIYLIHLPIVTLAVWIPADLPALHFWPLSVALCFFCGLVAGIAYHRMFERAALEAIRRHISDYRTKRLKAGS